MSDSRENALLTDEELFALVQKSDDEAFRTLYRRYDKRLLNYCLKILGNRQAAEDVFQTVVMTILEKRHSFGGGSFAGWLFTIARNFCIKSIHKRKATVDIDDVGHVLEDVAHVTDEDFLMRESLYRAIDKLPPEFQKPLKMKYFEGYSHDQIAARLDISVSLAKVRVFRAKKMLQKFLFSYIQELK